MQSSIQSRYWIVDSTRESPICVCVCVRERERESLFPKGIYYLAYSAIVTNNTLKVKENPQFDRKTKNKKPQFAFSLSHTDMRER